MMFLYIYLLGCILAVLALGLILKDQHKEEDNYENIVVYGCGCFMSWITLMIILIVAFDLKIKNK